jgi:diacylglycerol kinase family enzyme
VRAVAIVNGNARRLRGRLRGKLARALPGAVVLTHSLEEARGAIRAEIARGVDLIVLGGGDGTVVMGLTLIGEACRGAGRPEPAIGVLRLGSANAIADAVGASTDPATDLARLARGGGTWRSMRMLHVLGFRAPFVGMGVDAQVLEDRETIARIVDRVPGARWLVGDAARSAISIALRSVQRLATPSRVHAVISNLGSPAIEMKHGGPTGRAIATGDVLWKGTCTLVAGSTIPYFGFGLKLFVFAGARGDRFHLRCGDAGRPPLLRGAPAAFRGDSFSEQIRDFLCDRVQIELDDEVAIEAGGELLGRRRQLAIELGAPVIVASLAGDPR